MFFLIFLAIIPVLGSIAVLVIMIITMVKLAKAFGKSGGFAVGLIFLSLIFEAILAFDKSEYISVNGVSAQEPTVTPNNTTPESQPVGQSQKSAFETPQPVEQPQQPTFETSQAVEQPQEPTFEAPQTDETQQSPVSEDTNTTNENNNF